MAPAYRVVSPEEAAASVRDGDLVYIPLVNLDYMLDALVQRRDLKHVSVRLTTPGQDPGWLNPATTDDRFAVDFQIFIGDLGRVATDAGRSSYIPNLFTTEMKQRERPDEARFPDVFITRVSRPDEHGYVNFGPNMFNKRSYVRACRTVIAEIDPSYPLLFGDCSVHVSEIDYLVECAPPLRRPDLETRIAAVANEERRAELGDLLAATPERWLTTFWSMAAQRLETVDTAFLASLIGKAPPPDRETMAIAANVASVIPDGAVLQMGIGQPSASLVFAGAFDHARELGLHSEMVAPGWSRLVREGRMTNRGKPFREGAAVATAWAGSTAEDLEFVANNRGCELHPAEVVLDPRIMSANRKLHSVNSAISVDLLGQINSETVFGPRMVNGTGGQPESAISAIYSHGGRGITVMKSTALNGAASRVVALHEAGTVVTIPRFFADTIVTEYGVARLLGKSTRERVRELVAIAHPDFRAGLLQAASEFS